MPGRVSNRPAKALAPASKARSSRNTGGVEIPDEGSDTSLRAQICTVFGEVRKSNTGQRKLVVALRKIQESCCYEPPNPRKSTEEDFDEGEFNEEICRCALRVLQVKKSEPAGDRIVRFLGAFLKHATEAGRISF